MKFQLDIKNSTIHTEFWTLASFHQGISNSGAWLQFSRDGTSNTWQAGMSSDNSHVIRASDATDMLIANQNGNTTTDGNLDVGSTGDNQIQIHGTGATTPYAEFKVSNGQKCVWDFQNPSNSNIWSSIKVKGVKFMDFTPTDNLTIMHKATGINGSINIGLNQDGTPLATSNVKTYFNHVGSFGFMMMEGRYRDQGFLHFETN